MDIALADLKSFNAEDTEFLKDFLLRALRASALNALNFSSAKSFRTNTAL
jgi:hypothetical protein